MGFYNKGGPVAIITFEDVAGETHPLDVVVMGGSFAVGATIATGMGATILAAAPAGSAYALQSWGINGAAAAGGGWTEISDGLGVFDAAQCSPVGGVLAFGRQLNGQVSGGGISIANFLTVTVTFFLRYAPIAQPRIF